MGQHCLTKSLLKHFSRRQEQTTFVVIGALRFIVHIELAMNQSKPCLKRPLENRQIKDLND